MSRLQLFFSFLLIFQVLPICAQHDENNVHITDKHETEEHELKRHTISFVVSHTNINSARENANGSNWIATPSFGLNYNFNISHKWAIGLHNDIIVENIDLSHTHDSGERVIRQRPISIAAMVTYMPFKHLAFLAGGGMELSKHEDFPVVRFGLEAPFHLGNNWEFLGVLSTDIGIDSYDSITFGLGVAKLF